MGNEALLHHPDYAIAPGETLQEELAARDMTQAELSERTGRPLKTINEIIKGKAAITPETALQLERVLGIPASFWNNLERQYRETLAEIEERQRLSSHPDWIRKFPIDELARRNLIKRTSDPALIATQLLNFLGVSSPQTWGDLWSRQEANYRRSPVFEKSGSPEALACWLRQGELKAHGIKTGRFDKAKLRGELPALRKLTCEVPNLIKQRIVEICRNCGVIVVFVADFPKSYASGATRWLSSEKALIQLSCRNKRNDGFWFTFFHEIGHILLHGKKDAFIDNEPSRKATSKEEKEANEFATNVLVPKARFNSFVEGWAGSEDEVLSFASELEVHPGIIVGQLHFAEIIPYSRLNHLLAPFDITD